MFMRKRFRYQQMLCNLLRMCGRWNEYMGKVGVVAVMRYMNLYRRRRLYKFRYSDTNYAI